MTLPRYIKLSDAAERIGLPLHALETEIRNGRLVPITISGRRYVTDEILEQFHLCLVGQKARALPSSGTPPVSNTGPSETERASWARAAAQNALQKLSKPSPPTSLKSTSRQRQGAKRAAS